MPERSLTGRKGEPVNVVYQVEMRPRFLPSLVNDRFGDPGVHVNFLMERRAMLFDLGDIRALPTRAILRLSDVFVSHAHVDHFFGFDHLLRVLVGREKRLRLYGPPGFIDRVEAKLNGYTWNLAGRYKADLVFAVTEVSGNGHGRRAQFGLKCGFAREAEQAVRVAGGVLLDEASLQVRFAELDHGTPCLAFALQETAHINIWKNRLDELDLVVGPWLGHLKHAIHQGLPADTPIPVQHTACAMDTLPLGRLRDRIVSVTPGQKIGYVTDAAPGRTNEKAIVKLVSGADVLFIEAVFADTGSDLATERGHLTTGQAGAIARKAAVGRVEPFHFSARYTGEGAMLVQEVMNA